jgi:hypothetical protein
MLKKILVILTLLVISDSLYSQKIKIPELKLSIWKFKDCGQVMIDGEIHTIRGTNYMEYESMYEITMYTHSKHVVTVQRTPSVYYFSVLHPNGEVTCDEYVRGTLTDWVFKVFVLP